MANILGPDISKGIGQLLHEKRLRVPTYQRSYAWKKPQVKELFDDLRRAIEGGKSYYFLGSIVGCEVAGEPDVAEIVDGQQRLATTTILLAAIRDSLIAMGDTDPASRFEDEVLFKTEGFEKPTTKPRLTLSETDDEYFRKRILSRPGSPERLAPAPRLSHRLIADAAKYAADFVIEQTGTRSAPEKRRLFDRWTRFIRDSARAIFILVPNEADAFVVFETLNDRGLELTIADLTKNYLFSQAGKDHVQKVKTAWTRMVSVLATSTESEITKAYIYHLWSSLHGRTREREMFTAIKDDINTEQKAVEFADQLEQKAELYAAIRNPESDYWRPFGPTVRKHISILSRLKVAQIRMLILAAMDEFKQHDIEQILPCCVWWSVRFAIAGTPTGEVEGHYASRALQIRNGAIKTAADLIDSMSPAVPSDAQFKAAFAAESSSSASKPVARYYLQCLQRADEGLSDAHLGEDNEVTGSLEHILPQNPDPAVWKVSEQDVERLVWRYGNLALLHREANSDRGNRSFATAKAAYAASPLSLTKKVAAVTGEWDEAEIDKRQAHLAELAVTTWPIVPPNPKKKKKTR